MLTRLLKNYNYPFFPIIIISIVISYILSFINSFIGANSLFLVALISLAFSYPLTAMTRELEREEIDKLTKSKNTFYRYKKELIILWSLFIGITIGLFLSGQFITDFTYQDRFVNNITGNITENSLTFFEILSNNLKVAFFTFIICIFIYSGIIFVITWNSSILVYYLLTLKSIKEVLMASLFLLSHGLFEIGGYIFAGIAGALFILRFDLALSSKFYKTNTKNNKVIYKKDRRNTFQKILNKQLFKDIISLLLLSVAFIIIGAAIETL